MVALAEDPTDGRIAVVRELPGQVHGDLARRDQRSGAARTAEGLDGEAVAGGRGVENHLRRDATRLSGQDQVREDLFGLGQRDGLVVELGEGTDAGEGALELPDVVLHVGGDELQDVVGDLLVFAERLGAQDGQTGLEIGRVDLGDEPGEESAAQAVLERLDRLGRAVRRQDDLLGGALEVVVRVEELLLESLFALHELDVVDEQDVAVAIAPLEGQGRRGPQGVDEVVHERLGGDVEDLAPGVVLGDVVPDGVEQVGLAEAGVAVDEQGVVGAPGCLGDGLGGRVGQAVRRGGDEGLEGELGIELDRGGLPAHPGRLCRFWGGGFAGRAGGPGPARAWCSAGADSCSCTSRRPRTGDPTSLARVSSIMGR